MAREKVPVQIDGVEYQIESELEPLELQAIAKYVEEKMDEIRSSSTTATQTTSKLAILACLNIACELFRFKSSYENLNLAVNTKADEMISLIDAVVK